MKFLFILSLTLLFSPLVHGQRVIDSNASQVSFEISNMRFNTVEGAFSGMEGQIKFDPTDLASSEMNVCIDASSVDTDNKKRDEHLRKEDFFDVAKFPTICFVSNQITKGSSGFIASGSLTMHGITKTVKIPFTFSNNTFEGELSLNRTDYKVGGNGGFLVGKTVEMKIICVVE